MTAIVRRKLLKTGIAGAIITATGRYVSSQELNTMATNPTTQITPFLTFMGKANQAIDFYKRVFGESKVLMVQRYEPGDDGPAGTIKLAEFQLFGQRFYCIDSPIQHEWGFTPGVSFFVEDTNPATVTRYYNELSKDGKVYMPLGEYPFSKKFGWVEDKFGISWQVSTTKISETNQVESE